MAISQTNGSVKTPESNWGSRFKAFFEHLTTMSFSLVLILLLLWGWENRHERLFTAEEGWGYALGIIGGVLMLLLLTYPLRKHWSKMSRMGPVKTWFKVHMLFGVLGPSFILFHSSFSLGSLNSSVALICMLLVASSGLIGRYLYARIHHGLYGASRQMKEFQVDMDEAEERLEREISFDKSDEIRLHEYSQHFNSDSKSVLFSLHELFSTSVLTRMSMPKEMALLNGRGINQEEMKAARKLLRRYFASIRRTARFRFYRNMFGLWHVLHLPLFIMTIITGFTHVYAVHVY